MPRWVLGSLPRLLTVLFPLGLAACADTLTSKETASSTTLQRDYDKTLTKAEQKAAISDLQNAAMKKPDATAPE
jgi:hypothetical protein